MAKQAREMTAAEIRHLSMAGFFSVGGVPGLQIQVTDTGAKSWVLRVMVGTKRRRIGLGSFQDVGLSDAKKLARETKEKIKQGIDPVAEKQQAKRKLLAEQISNITFRLVAEQFINKKTLEFKDTSKAKQRQRMENALSTYAYPAIGEIPVIDVSREHILQVLSPIWEVKTSTAERLRNNLERILDLAEVKGLRTGSNPARWQGNLSHILPSPTKISKAKHMEALPVEELPAFMQELRTKDTMASLALRFAILTCSRSIEVRFADWAEFDLDKALWVVPEERMKAGKRHAVPLCKEAVSLLQSIKPPTPKGLVFLNVGKRLSENAMTSVIKKVMGRSVTQHGFRSTFKDWARTHTRYPDEASELALAHVHDDKTRAAYARDELIETRQKLMADWGEYCQHGKQETAKVITLKA